MGHRRVLATGWLACREARLGRRLAVRPLAATCIITALLTVGLPEAAGAWDSRRPVDDRKPGLLDGQLREAVAASSAGRAAPRGVELDGDSVRVEVHSSLPSAQVSQIVEELGGTVEGSVEGELVQALVPLDQLLQLESRPDIDYLQPPPAVNIPVNVQGRAEVRPLAALGPTVGQHVSKTNADDWQAAGFTGTGVKIGIVDLFQQSTWNAAVAAGELRAPAGTFCRADGASCSVWGASSHGVSVAEVISDIAPDATYYLVSAITTADLQAGVDYLAANGVDLVTRSLTAPYDGAGDGTGALAAVIDSAVAQGMTWFNSAGNSGGPWPWLNGQSVGSYWRGSWNDPDGDGWLNFSGTDELMAFNCRYINGLRWSDWGANRTDYDIYVYADAAATTLVSTAEGDQAGGLPPIERPGCSGEGIVNYVAIKLFSAGAGTTGDVLEFMTNGGGLEYWQNPESAAAPAADSASPGMLTVGAVGEDPFGTSLSPYSSNGPTNDGRIKPDLSAATCVHTHTDVGCFNGTSAATPAVAGAAALILDAGLASTPTQVRTYLLGATVDRGVAGSDNEFGRGELLLPAPPSALECPADDAFEPNDGPGAAHPTISGAPVEAMICSGDDDWFGLEVVAGRSVTATAAFIHSQGDVDLELLDPLGAEVASSATAADQETVSHVAEMTGLYSVRLSGAQNAYSLTMTSAACPPDDPLEPNDTFAAPGAAPEGTTFRAIACPNDDDWYSIDVVEGDALDVDVQLAHRFGDLDVQVFDPANNEVASSLSETDEEHTHHVAAASGAYRVRIYGPDGALNTYAATLSIDPLAPTSFLPLTPDRILDSRTGVGRPGTTKVAAGGTVPLDVTGVGGVSDSGVSAVILNVTVTQPTAGGYVTVYPAGVPRPGSSNLNYAANQTIANLVVAKVGTGGIVNLYTSAGTHLIADVVGYFPQGSGISSLTPDRILDSRTGVGRPGTTKVAAGGTVPLDVTGVGGVPDSGVSAVILNVTVTQPTAGGYVTVYPAGVPRPGSSNLNYAANQTIANLVVAKVGTGGIVNLYTSAGTHLIADVVGYFPQGSGISSLTPDRILDSRTGVGRPGTTKVAAGGTVPLDVTGVGGVPDSGVSAVILNVTVTQPTAGGYVTVYPAGVPRPGSSNLNYAANQTIANLVVAKVGTGGIVNLYTSAGTHLIADVVGYFPEPSSGVG